MKRRVALALLLVVVAAAPVALAQDSLVEEGRRAFARNGCHGCHTIKGAGTPIARDLSRVGARYEAAYLARWLRDPSHVRPSTHMPAIELTDSDIEALAAYLAAQK